MLRGARFYFAASLLLTAFALARAASAAPESHILRIDPRAGVKDGKPTLTTVIEVVQFKRLSDVLAPCVGATGSATLSCWSEQLEKPGALWDPFPFPEGNAHLLVKVAGEDTMAKFGDKTQWGKAQNEPNVGTSWLLAIDASSGMGARFGDARAIAHEFIEAMGPNDLMDIMLFDDVQVVKDTKWKTHKQRADLVALLNEVKSPFGSHGRDRALFSQIKTMTRDAFGSLGNSDQPDSVPLHQAMVVLSNGAGRGDPESASPSADVFHAYLDKGRFPEDNTSLPKTPLPVISIWLPNASGMMESIYRNNEAQFMQALANPEIGGYFDVVQEGQGAAKGKTIIGLVRARFNAMWLIHWKLSCINPSVEQTFNLVFENTHPVIAPDGTFKEVPLGIDPTQWPLDVDFDKTTKEAQDKPLYPGGSFTVYGDFCWGGEQNRAEAYFIPAGTKPQQTSSRDPELAKKAMQSLKAQNMLGKATAAGDAYVTFTVPDDDKVLEGAGESTVARLVVYDNKAHRASAVDQKTVLTLKAKGRPLSLPLLGGIAGLAVVIVLLVLVLMRGGGKKRGGGPPPAPVGPGYGAPPGGGYGAPRPPGAGYGMMQAAPALAGAGAPPAFAGAGAPPAFAGAGAPDPLAPQAVFAPPPSPPSAHADRASADAPPGAHAPATPGAVVQVRCPSCAMMTMATIGAAQNMCFSCGQPLPTEPAVRDAAGIGVVRDAAGIGVVRDAAGIDARGGGAFAGPGFPVTGPLSAQPLVPPANPYGAPPGAATMRGASGAYTIRPGGEVRVGRDPSQCSIYLGEPRVSGVHATLKFESGQLFVRDETSNNGTWIAGARIGPGAWTPVPQGAQLRFGPIEFSVQLEA